LDVTPIGLDLRRPMSRQRRFCGDRGEQWNGGTQTVGKIAVLDPGSTSSGDPRRRGLLRAAGVAKIHRCRRTRIVAWTTIRA
jgi:hypothetical protein